MTKTLFAFACLCIASFSFSQNPLLLKDIYPGTTGSIPAEIVKTPAYVFFNAEDDDVDTDKGLYRTDGTWAGTIKLNLTDTTYLSTSASKLTALGNKIIFAGDNLNFYGEVWVSDGTQAGTKALERFQPATYSSNQNRKVVMDMAQLNNDVVYSVRSTNNHLLLKKTDGTPGAMQLVYDFGVWANTDAQVTLFTTVNNILFFILYDGNSTDQLWRSDGTTGGTYLLKDFTTARYVASRLMPAGNNLYIMLVEPGTGNVLWKSNGTDTGTVALKTIGTTAGNNNYPPNAAVGSTFYFTGADNTNGTELWKSDGTAGGTMLAADINAGAAGSNPNWFTVLNNQLYFSATTAATGNELWKYDGSIATLVKDIYPGTTGSTPASLAVANNRIVFSAIGDTSSGNELWMSDGTGTNTAMVADIASGSASSTPALMIPGNPVYFTANTAAAGRELYKYDNSLFTPHVLYVNDSSFTGDLYTTDLGNDNSSGAANAPFYSLPYAISRASDGDTIFVDAGNYFHYPATWSINKSVTILGSNYTTSPNDAVNPLLANATQNRASVLYGAKYNIGASNITIKGFTLSSGTDTAINSRDGAVTYNNITVQNNKFIIGGTTGMNMTGRSTANPPNQGMNVLNNRFEKTDTLFGTSVFVAGFNGVNITGNAFVLNGGTALRQSAAFLAGPNFGTTNSFNYSGNYGDGIRIGLGGCNRFNTGVVSNNYFINALTGITVVPSYNQNTNMTITGNKILNFVDVGMVYSRTFGSNAGSNNVTISGNEITHNATGRTVSIPRLLLISNSSTVAGANVICSNNKLMVSGNFATIPTTGIAGIEIYPGPSKKTTITNNDVFFTGTNAVTLPADTTVTLYPSGILVRTDGSAATMAANSEMTISNNAVAGFNQSIAFIDLATGAGNTAAMGYGLIPGGAIVNINNNSFTVGNLSINNGFNSQVVNANCNWYGSVAANTVAGKITPMTVRYTPYLGNGTDNDVATGFQPVAGSCINISGFSPTEAPVGTLVTIKGFGFNNVNTIQFNGTNAGGFAILSDSAVTALVPNNAVTGTITVNATTASVTSANNFMVIPDVTVDTVNICPGSNAILISSMKGSSYQWKLATDTGNINIVNGINYSGVTTDTLRLLNVPASATGSKYVCLVSGSTLSKTVAISIGNKWNGGSSTDWSNPLNWGCSGKVPDINTNVTITSGAVIVTGTSSAKSVTANPGTTVTVGAGATLIIKNQ
ncbi:MAG: ELWxxDGT repeat protein [Chitinophagaceae bacterium]